MDTDPLPWLCSATGYRYPDETTAAYFCGHLPVTFVPRPEFGIPSEVTP